MEEVMRALLTIFLLAMSSPLAADPPKPTSAPASATTERRLAVLMLASNEGARTTRSVEAEQAQPLKHRIARVTTCRCGDVQPVAESDSDQQ
jgi:hypothetical protein